MNSFSRFFGATCVSIVALGAGSVYAADMYHGGGMKDGPAYVPPPLWTGFYVGVNGGGSFGDSNNLALTNTRDLSQADIGQFYRDGGFGGGQFGYNFGAFGFGSHFVFGVEADIQGGDIGSSFTRADLNYGFAPALFNAKQSIDYFGTFRGRLGYAFNQALVYATVGFAYADVQTSVNINRGFNYLTSNQVETGYAVGGGVEYLFAPCWSVKVEYQYIDLGSNTVSGVAADGSLDTVDVNNNFHTIRVGVNYHLHGDYVPLK